MHSVEQWQQSAVFNPTDPTQKKIERYVGVPGGYATFYFNRVPVTGNLKGPFTTAIGTGAGLTIGVLLGTLLISAGAWGLRKAGVLKKPLSGPKFRFKRLFKRRR